METKAKYNYLLAPVKDLVENWNVDLAADLEDYLEELEKCLILMHQTIWFE